VGLVALGSIGRLVLERLRTTEIETVAYEPFPGDEERNLLVDLPTLFSTCDVISLHLPWIPETEGLIHHSLLRSMKEGATLINTARGAVMDEQALCSVLADRPDITAVLDVTHPEPPVKNSPLYSLPNVVLTPHIAGSVGPEVARMGVWMAQEFARYVNREPLLHVVRPQELALMA
jgi:phosphoglycerate dehydrogenase-like enzyme